MEEKRPIGKGKKPKLKKLDPNNKNDLRNYTEVDGIFFTELYKKTSKTGDYFKIVENISNSARYYVWTSFLLKNKP